MAFPGAQNLLILGEVLRVSKYKLMHELDEWIEKYP